MDIIEVRHQIKELKKEFKVGRKVSVKVSDYVSGSISICLTVNVITNNVNQFINAVNDQLAYINPENDATTDYFPGGNVSIDIETTTEAIQAKYAETMLSLLAQLNVSKEITFINGFKITSFAPNSYVLKNEKFKNLSEISVNNDCTNDEIITYLFKSGYENYQLN